MSSIEYSSGLTISSGNNGNIVFNPNGTGAVKVGSNNVLNASDLGSSIQAYNAKLADIAGLTPSNNQIIKWNGSNFVASSDSDLVNTADDITLYVDGSNVWSVKDAGITAAKLGADCVDGSKIADYAVNSEHLVNACIDASHINSAEVPTLAASNTFTNDLNVFKGLTATGQVSKQKSGASGFKYEVQNEAQTTDNTTTTLHSVSLQDNAVTVVKALIIGCSDDGVENASYELKAHYKRISSTSTLLANSVETIYSTDGTMAAIVDLNSDTGRVKITGKNSNIRWNISVIVQVSPVYAV